MKKFWKKGIAFLVVAAALGAGVAAVLQRNSGSFGGSYDGGSSESGHVHTFAESKRTLATCKARGERILSCRCGETKTEVLDRLAHDMVNGVCEDCGAEETKGLRLDVSTDGTYYIMKGIGNCTDTDVIIPREKNGKPVTEIAAYAFGSSVSGVHKEITSINIPDTIDTIGKGAFNQCLSLTGIIVDGDNGTFCSVHEDLYTKDQETLVRYALGKKDTSYTFLSTVKKIEAVAFCDAVWLTSITVPNAVTEIGERAFSGCDALKKATIGKGVETIGAAPFASCDSLKTISVNSQNEAYQDIDGNLYTKDGTILLQYAIGKTDESLVVPDGVITIGASAVAYNKDLRKVELPATLTTIEDDAFSTTNINSLTFAGTKKAWKAVSLGKNWCYQIGAVSVTCKDGGVNL